MIKRGLAYRVTMIWRYYVRGLIKIMVDRLFQRSLSFRVVHRIHVADPSDATRDNFVNLVASALTLAKAHDELRFRRILKEIRTIINLRSVWGYAYYRPSRTCLIQFDRWSNGDPNETSAHLASALVCQATVGRIISLGVLRTHRNAERIDALSAKEAARFLRGLGWVATRWDPDKLVSLPPGAQRNFVKGTLRRLLADLRK
jgi:hypothetical protein